MEKSKPNKILNVYKLYKNGIELGTTRAEYAYNAKENFYDTHLIPPDVWQMLQPTESGYLADDQGDIWEIR